MYEITDALVERAEAHRPWSDVACIFPLMGKDEFDDLCNSIKKHGLNKPIECYDGKVTDGRNRQLACLAVGKEPQYEDLQGEWALDQLASRSWEINYNRRHLTPSQKGMVAAKMRTFLSDLGGADTVAQAAKQTGASERMVKRTTRILNEGSDELVEAVEVGQVTADDAEKILSLPKAQQTERVQAVQQGRASRVAQPQADSGTSDQDAWLQGVQADYETSSDEVARILKRFQQKLEDGELVNFPWNKFRVELESAKSMIEMNAPHKYCCGGKGGKSCLCGGSGFITKFNYDQPEIRRALEGRK